MNSIESKKKDNDFEVDKIIGVQFSDDATEGQSYQNLNLEYNN
jgi:hypothetical protein